MVAQDDNPYRVTENAEIVRPQRLTSRFPTMFWIGTLAFSGFTCMLLQSGADVDFSVGLRFFVTAAILWSGGVAIAISSFRVSFVLGISLFVQIGIWLWMIYEGIGDVDSVNPVLGSICFVMFALSLFYWWKDSAIEQGQSESDLPAELSV